MRYGIGLDIGIASTGYAVMELDDNDHPIEILHLGARVFNKPENQKDGSTPAEVRREARGMRRRLRRKAHRKLRINYLLVKEGIITEEQRSSLFDGVLPDIYELRVQALERLVTKEEFARILIHLSQRRGFKSNRINEAKSKKENEDKKMVGCIDTNTKRMEEMGYRTVAEMFVKDTNFNDHMRNTRNKWGSYKGTVTRDLVENEVRMIFAAQRELGNAFATSNIEEKYIKIWGSQRSFDEGPGGKSLYGGNLIERMVGNCTFEEGEVRAPKASYSSERATLWQKINNIRFLGEGVESGLSSEQREILCAYAHNTERVTYKQIRKICNIPMIFLFNHVKYDKSKQCEADILAQEQATKFEHLKAYHAMRKALKDYELGADRISSIMPNERNEVARIFTLYKNKDKVAEELSKVNITELDRKAFLSKLVSFSKFSNLSIKALNKITPFLELGYVYDKACKEADYNFHGKESKGRKKYISLKNFTEEIEWQITSPAVRKSLFQCAKVINAIILKMGTSPVYINVELAREMTQSKKVKETRDKENDSNRKRNEAIKSEIKSVTGWDAKPYDIVKLKLYQDQQTAFSSRCPYCKDKIIYEELFGTGYQVDHIIPYSETFDDRYINKILVHTKCNQQKGNRLPLQFLQGETREWFIICVKNSKMDKRKKNALLKPEPTKEDKNKFKQRDLQGTQLVSRFMYNYLRNNLQFSPLLSDYETHVTTVNGGVTDIMRKRLSLKKTRTDGDKHHAMDAAVIACATEGMKRKITLYSQNRENQYNKTRANAIEKDVFPPPYKDFVAELEDKLKDVFISRALERKTTGAAHEKTIMGLAPEGVGGEPLAVFGTVQPKVLIKKVPLTKVKLNKHGEIDNYYCKEADMPLYNAIKERLRIHANDSQKAFAEPLVKPGGDGRLVSRVKLIEKSTLSVPAYKVDGKVIGWAKNDKRMRVDIYHVSGKGGGYYLVPIDAPDTIKEELPRKAVSNKPYDEWPEMKEEDFLFSLHMNDLIRVNSKGGIQLKSNKDGKDVPLTQKEKEQGVFLYFKGIDIANGTLKGAYHDNSCRARVGAKTLQLFEKYEVDILGDIKHVSKETRQVYNKKKKV